MHNLQKWSEKLAAESCFPKIAKYNNYELTLISFSILIINPAGIHLLKANNRNTRTRCEICSKSTIKTWRQWRRSGVFIINFERISQLVPVFLLLTLNMQLPAGNVLIIIHWLISIDTC